MKVTLKRFLSPLSSASRLSEVILTQFLYWIVLNKTKNMRHLCRRVQISRDDFGTDLFEQ